MSRGAEGVRVEQAAGEAEPRDGKGQGRRRGREAGVEASPRQWRRRRAQGIREVTRQGTPRAPPRSSVCSLQPLISRPDHVPRAEFDKPPPPPRVVTYAAHSLPLLSVQVLRQTEELEPEADPSSGPSAKHRQADTDTPADLEALLPHGALLGHRAARQWRPALQSIAEGGG